MDVVWLRPEYQGRETELIHLGDAARSAGVTAAAVANWQRRYQDFPGLVLIAGQVKFVPRAEFEAFVAALRAGTATPVHRPRRERRPNREVAAERITAAERRLVELRRVEATQEARLRRTRERIAAVQARLETDRRRVAGRRPD